MVDNLKELLAETSEELGLKPALIEKDWYITHALQALNNLVSDEFDLVFAGGTCLAKAHRIVQRMSEDIDFKIVFKEKVNTFTASSMRKKLSLLKENIKKTLINNGFNYNDGMMTAKNNNHYLQINLPYPSLSEKDNYLRPHLQIELTVSELLLPLVKLPVSSLIEDVIGRKDNFPSTMLNCVSVHEMAAEKWVGLTRRVGMVNQEYTQLDKALVRHIYDIHHINSINPLDESHMNLFETIILNDKEQFKNQYPEYAKNPLLEIRRSLNFIEHDKNFKNYWNDFMSTMIMDNKSLNYDQAYETIKLISESILTRLDKTLTPVRKSKPKNDFDLNN